MLDQIMSVKMVQQVLCTLEIGVPFSLINVRFEDKRYLSLFDKKKKLNTIRWLECVGFNY